MTWGITETEKVTRIVDRLVATHQQMVESQRAGTAPVDRAIEEQECAELRLLLSAVNSKDTIGLVSLCSVFWSTRNQLRREVTVTQKQHTTPQVVEALVQELGVRCGAWSQNHLHSPIDEGLLQQHISVLRSQNFELLANFSLQLQQQYAVLCTRVYGSSDAQVTRGEGRIGFNQSGAAHGPAAAGSAVTVAVAVPAGERSALDDESAMRLDSIRQMARSALDTAAARNAEICASLTNIASCVASSKSDVSRSAVEALAHAAQQPSGGPIAAAGSAPLASVPVALPDGSIPWGLVRFVPSEAAVGDSLLSIVRRAYGADDLTEAERDPLGVLSIATGRPVVLVGRASTSPSGEQVLTSGTGIDATFTRRCNVIVRVFHRISGMVGALTSIDKRLKEIQSGLLPAALEAAETAREELWGAEIGRLQDASGLVLHADEAESQAHDVSKAREKLALAELRVRHLEEAVRISTSHKGALERANVGAISSMLENRVCELMAEQADSAQQLRLVYVCKELPPGWTIDMFASSFDVSKEQLQVFEDHFSDLSPVSKTRRRTVRTMVYVPTRVPRPSVSAIDEELRGEMDSYQRMFPSFPPNTEIAEQLAAVRQGDVVALSALLTNARKRLDKFTESTEVPALKVQIMDLQGALKEQRAKAEQLLLGSRATDLEMQALQRSIAAEAEASAERMQELQAKLTAATSSLQAELQNRKSTESTVAELRATVAEVEAKLLDAVDQRRAAQEQLGETARISAECDARLRRVQQLEAQVRASEEVLEEERLSSHSANALCTQLRSQVATLQQCIDTQNDEILRLRRELKRQGEAAARAAVDSEALQQELAAQREVQQQLTHQHQKALGQLSTANANLASLRLDQQSLRETYLAKEIPAGRTADEFAASLGVAADVVVPFFDAALGRHFLYFPVQASRLPIGDEDKRLRQEVQAAQGSKSLGAVLDQLAALRSGDSAALSRMASGFRSAAVASQAAQEDLQRQLRERMAELNAIQQQSTTSAASAALARAAASTTTIDDEAEDLTWLSPEVGKKKITLLRDLARTLRGERDEWRRMCDEYRQRSSEFESLESAKADLLKRQAAQSLLTEATSIELKSLTARLRASEDGRVQDAEKFSAARRRLMDEHQAALAEVESHLTAVKNRAAAELQTAREKSKRDGEKISRLTDVLRQNGIAIQAANEFT